MLHSDFIILVSIVLGCALIRIAISDYNRFIIPDIISLPLIPCGLLANWYLIQKGVSHSHILEYIVAMILGIALLYLIAKLYEHFRGRAGLGMGDVKLAGVAGAWTGVEGLNHVILLACFSALTVILFRQLVWKIKMKANTAIPLGLFLAPAIWVVWQFQMAG